MTRQQDTYQTIFGAMPLVNPWWTNVRETNVPDFSDDNPFHWVGWTVVVTEIDPDTGETVDDYQVQHADIMRALEMIHKDPAGHDNAFLYNVRSLLYGDADDCDFDSNTADLVLQFATIGEMRYG